MTPSATRSRMICHIVAAAARVEAGGRLVEEDDPRVADQGHREVEPAAHAAGVGRGRSSWPPRPGRTAPAARRRRAGPRARPRWCRSAIRSRFSSPVSRLSTAENWPVTPIAARTASGSAARSWPATARPARRRRAISVDRICTVVVLPAPFGPSSAKTVPCGDVQVDAVEHDLVAVGLAQAGGRDRRSGGVVMGVSFERRRSGAADDDVAEGGAGAHLDGLVGRRRARRRSSSALRTRPKRGVHVEPGGGALGGCRPRSRRARSPARPSRATTSPSRTSPLAVLASTPASARSTAMSPLAGVDPQVAGDRADPGVAVGVLDHGGAVDLADAHVAGAGGDLGVARRRGPR